MSSPMNLPPLPEPVAHQVVARGVTAKLAVRADVAEEWADNCRREGAYGASVRTLYTADQMRAYGEACAAAEPVAPKREPLTDQRVRSILREADWPASMLSGFVFQKLIALIRQAERAHGIGDE